MKTVYSTMGRSALRQRHSALVASRCYSKAESLTMIKAEKIDGVGIITLNRPKALNALCQHLIEELVLVGQEYDQVRDSLC